MRRWLASRLASHLDSRRAPHLASWPRSHRAELRGFGPVPVVLDEEEIRRHRAQNRVHTGLLILAMFGLTATIGFAVAGTTGLIWGSALGIIGLVVMGRMSPTMVMAMYGGRRIAVAEAPRLHVILRQLARRAGLKDVPRLYYVRSRLLNAFAVGDRRHAVIGITDGLLRSLSMRELAGVLAHEISHVRAGDLRVMAIADVLSRITGLFATLGQILLLLNLPLLLFGQATVSWLLIALLLVAPAASGLLQLALSRRRESDADLEAALITGDPRGLASALQKMDDMQASAWEQILWPGRRVPDPSLFRTHPSTEERVERLLSLERDSPHTVMRFGRGVDPWTGEHEAVSRAPRRRVSGVWY